jgi:hypothetical protein
MNEDERGMKEEWKKNSRVTIPISRTTPYAGVLP